MLEHHLQFSVLVFFDMENNSIFNRRISCFFGINIHTQGFLIDYLQFSTFVK